MRNKEVNYLNYIKDKKVIIVGPANYLVGERRGSWIDDHDIVIRINGRYSYREKIDYGAKVHVMYLSPGPAKTYIYKKYTKKRSRETTPPIHRMHRAEQRARVAQDLSLWGRQGLRWIMVRRVVDGSEIDEIQREITYKWTYINYNLHSTIDNALGESEAYTGVIAVEHILSAKPKLLSIVGFNFYKTDYTCGVSHRGDTRVHSKDANLRYFAEMVGKHNNLVLDDCLLNEIKKTQKL